MSNVDYTLNDRRTEKLYLRIAEKYMERTDCTHSAPAYVDNSDVLKDFFMGDDET